MKILITSDLFDTTINGVVTSIKNLEKELAAAGHEVRILTVSDQCRSYQKGNVYYIKSVPSGIYPGIRLPVSRGEAFVEELIAWKPDVVHSQCEFATLGFAKKIAKKTGAALIHTYHTLYEQYTEYIPIGKTLGRAALGKWMKARLREVDTIIAPTGKVLGTLNQYGMTNEIAVIPTGIDIKKFTKKENSDRKKALKEKYDIPEDKKVLLSLGRLGFEKRIDELLEGLKMLLGEGVSREDMMLVIVGGGPAEESLRSLAKELGIENHVRFTGMICPEEIADYYQLGDIFVCASTSETQGLTYIEAMASGLPLVCRKDLCLYGVLEDGGNGYFYETVDTFAQAVRRMADNISKMSEMGARSRQIAENYGTRRFGNRVENCYYQAVFQRKCEEYEGITVCKEQKNSFKEWCRTCYAHARRSS